MNETLQIKVGNLDANDFGPSGSWVVGRKQHSLR